MKWMILDDTHIIVKRVVAQGMPPEQTELIILIIPETVNNSFKRVSKSSSSKCEMNKMVLESSQKLKIQTIRAEIQNLWSEFK